MRYNGSIELQVLFDKLQAAKLGKFFKIQSKERPEVKNNTSVSHII
jgi:hypothetical protein